MLVILTLTGVETGGYLGLTAFQLAEKTSIPGQRETLPQRNRQAVVEDA